jgi:hypothetical protein
VPVNMERRALVALGLLWLGGVPAFAAVDIDVTGLWSAAVRTGKEGAGGDQMIFTSRNATLTDGLLFDATYAIDGDKITMTPMDERHGPPAVHEFKLERNKMTIIAADGKRRVLTRVGKIRFGADPIIGDWSGPFLGNWRLVQRFSRNGATQVALPFETDKGPYRIAGDTMHIELVGKPALALTVRREGNQLITRNADGKETRFVKFEY